MVAAHAVASRCPLCDRPVRTSIALHQAEADLADLHDTLTRLQASHSSPPEALASAADAIRYEFARLLAELRGQHLHCYADHPFDPDGLRAALAAAAISPAAQLALH
jgi:multidrug resistance efflux pump